MTTDVARDTCDCCGSEHEDITTLTLCSTCRLVVDKRIADVKLRLSGDVDWDDVKQHGLYDRFGVPIATVLAIRTVSHAAGFASTGPIFDRSDDGAPCVGTPTSLGRQHQSEGIMRLDDFWRSSRWLEYERAYGDEPGTRAALLASATWTTRVVDIRPDPALLWRSMRRSYRALVHRAQRECDIIVWSRPTAPNETWIREFKQMHFAEAGRQTRSDETWDIMCRWLDTGDALLIGAARRDPQKWGAFAYFAIHQHVAHYFSAAASMQNLNHALIVNAIGALRFAGVWYLDLGWQGHATDEKGRNIEFFRRGCGGVDMRFDEELPE